jgi:hypothetical protein
MARAWASRRRGLAFHRHVAGAVGRRSPDEDDVHREGLVEEPLLAVDLHHAHELLGRARVDPAALLAGIDERADPHLAERAGTMGGDIPEEVRDGAQRQVVGLDPVVGREPGELGHQRPVAADRRA